MRRVSQSDSCAHHSLRAKSLMPATASEEKWQVYSAQCCIICPQRLTLKVCIYARLTIVLWNPRNKKHYKVKVKHEPSWPCQQSQFHVYNSDKCCWKIISFFPIWKFLLSRWLGMGTNLLLVNFGQCVFCEVMFIEEWPPWAFHELSCCLKWASLA